MAIYNSQQLSDYIHLWPFRRHGILKARIDYNEVSNDTHTMLKYLYHLYKYFVRNEGWLKMKMKMAIDLKFIIVLLTHLVKK